MGINTYRILKCFYVLSCMGLITAVDKCSFDGKLGECFDTCPSTTPQKKGICPIPSQICCIIMPPTPPPTPPPGPTPPPTPSLSSKKGVAASPGNFNCEDFAALNVSWFINWNQGTSCTGWPASIHIPQIWGAGNVGQIPPGDSWVMGFNEPNFQNIGGGSDITPQNAAQLWPKLHELNRPLVSPATSECSPGVPVGCNMNGFDWMDSWLQACNGNCKFDAVGVHSYSCDANHVNDLVNKFATRYGKPVWLTEFSCGNGTAQDNLALAQSLLPMLNANPNVMRYFWCATTLQQAQEFPFLVGSQLLQGHGDGPPFDYSIVGKYFRI